MIQPTDMNTFQTKIQSIPEIKTLVDDVAKDAEQKELTDITRDGGTTSLVLVATIALWKLLKLGIEVLRQMNENKVVEKRIHLIRQLQEMGYERQAPFIVVRLFAEIRERPEDDPVLKKLTEIDPE